MKKLIALFAATILASTAAFAGEFEDISIKELKDAIKDKKVVVIDVMGDKSYNNGHVPTAISYSANADDLAKVLPEDKDALIVAYCGGPTCSAYKKAAEAASALGYTNVKHLSAGISGWMQAGEKTEKTEG